MYRPRAMTIFMRDTQSPAISTHLHRRTTARALRPTPYKFSAQAQIRKSTTSANNSNDHKVTRTPSNMYSVSPTELITKQRLNRPVSPNLGIYSWEIMICGALHRNTAILLSTTMYIFGFSYVALPLLGVPVGSAELVAGFGSLPIVAKVMFKWIYGFALSFHTAHGLRHLIWDTGAMLTNGVVKSTGTAALIAGALGATALCFV